MKNNSGRSLLETASWVAGVASAAIALIAYYQSSSSQSGAGGNSVSGNSGSVIINQSSPGATTIINPLQNPQKILEVSPTSNASKQERLQDYKLTFQSPSSWGDCLKLPRHKDSRYSAIFDMESIGQGGCYFSGDALRLNENLRQASLFRTELNVEVYSDTPSTDLGFIEGSTDPYTFSREQKLAQFEPLNAIYDARTVSVNIRKIIEGEEPTGRMTKPDYRIRLWNNVDGYTDYFGTTYVESRDGFLRGICYFATQGQDYNFNIQYSCLLFNKESKVAVRIGAPLHNVIPNEYKDKVLFANAKTEGEVQEAIKLAKEAILSKKYGEEARKATDEIKSVAESVKLFSS